MSDLQEKIDRLRTAAQWLEDTELPDGVNVIIGQNVVLSFFPADREALKAIRRIVGPVVKDGSGGSMTLKGEVSGIRATIFMPDGVCERVQTGMTMRPVMVPSGDYETVPVYEWDCGPVLADESQAVA